MNIKVFVCNPFKENTFIVYDELGEALIIDPGFYNEDEFAQARDFIESNKLKIRYLLNTHLHLDHSMGAAFVEKTFCVSLSASAKDAFLQESALEQARLFGLPWDGEIPEIKTFLNEGDKIVLGSLTFNVLEVPGHTPGGLAFYEKDEGVVFSGDTLFANEIGRTDIHRGSESDILRSIREKLFVLPPNTVVFPGHGPSTTIGEEVFLTLSE